MDKLKVILSGGGTGGHIYPALAIINRIKEEDKNSEILYIGTTDRMEKDIVPARGIHFVGIEICISFEIEKEWGVGAFF